MVPSLFEPLKFYCTSEDINVQSNKNQKKIYLVIADFSEYSLSKVLRTIVHPVQIQNIMNRKKLQNLRIRSIMIYIIKKLMQSDIACRRHCFLA